MENRNRDRRSPARAPPQPPVQSQDSVDAVPANKGRDRILSNGYNNIRPAPAPPRSLNNAPSVCATAEQTSVNIISNSVVRYNSSPSP